jgi:hypothetical protein
MKAVFLVLSFVVVLILVRFFAVKLSEYLRGKKFHKTNNAKLNEIKEVIDSIEIDNHKITNTESRLVLSGTLNEKQNLDSKYIGNVYRAKNGRFVSKKELSNV